MNDPLPADADNDLPFMEYLVAYRYGWLAHERLPGRRFEDVEPELRAGWEQRDGLPTWHRALPAVQKAWERVGQRQAAPPLSPAEPPAWW
jgi:hypothetical protein